MTTIEVRPDRPAKITVALASVALATQALPEKLLKDLALVKPRDQGAENVPA